MTFPPTKLKFHDVSLALTMFIWLERRMANRGNSGCANHLLLSFLLFLPDQISCDCEEARPAVGGEGNLLLQLVVLRVQAGTAVLPVKQT